MCAINNYGHSPSIEASFRLFSILLKSCYVIHLDPFNSMILVWLFISLMKNVEFYFKNFTIIS